MDTKEETKMDTMTFDENTDPLTVQELIKKLKEMPQDAVVYHHPRNAYNYMDTQWNSPVALVKNKDKAVFLIGGFE